MTLADTELQRMAEKVAAETHESRSWATHRDTVLTVLRTVAKVGQKELEKMKAAVDATGKHYNILLTERDSLRDENERLREALEYTALILKVLSRLGHCPEGGEQTGNRMHVMEAEGIVNRVLAQDAASSKVTNAAPSAEVLAAAVAANPKVAFAVNATVSATPETERVLSACQSATNTETIGNLSTLARAFERERNTARAELAKSNTYSNNLAFQLGKMQKDLIEVRQELESVKRERKD